MAKLNDCTILVTLVKVKVIFHYLYYVNFDQKIRYNLPLIYPYILLETYIVYTTFKAPYRAQWRPEDHVLAKIFKKKKEEIKIIWVSIEN